MMRPPHPSGFALPSVLIILSLCALLQIFAWRQTSIQQRFQNAQWSSQQMEQRLQSLVFIAAQQFNSPTSPWRWKSRQAFDKWRASEAACASICVNRVDFSHEPLWQGEYQIRVWPLAGLAPEAPIFVYEVTATITQTQNGITRTVRAVWQSDEARWISWRAI